MAETKPSFHDRKGGWSSINDEGANLGSYGAVPPEGEPEIFAARDSLPELLVARFYFWDKVPDALSRIVGDPDSEHRLNAIDVALSKVSPTDLSILVSTRTTALLHRKDGVLASLAKLLDPDVKRWRDAISPTSDHHSFSDPDIFLWLTSRSNSGGQLDSQLSLTHIAGIHGTDSASRTAELRSGIDYKRANFLTSVAEGDTLGPVDLDLSMNTSAGAEHYNAVIFADGGFKLRKSEVYMPGILDGGELMLAANMKIAHLILRRIEHIYIAGMGKWKTEREDVIEGAITDLRDRYEAALAKLESVKNREPKAS
ncbi:hypothetical protein [Brachybacterium alimentarium]|uniref:hypothetical protein n=1 Tax=Brachybacterium alimentarium TaxID=47845 RepID=UPI0011C03344|nr:hypothetical protein [Brachybacterium alimentarium]